MKGEIMLKILDAVAGAVSGSAELFAVFMEAGYGASLSRFEYVARRREARGKNGGDGAKLSETERRRRFFMTMRRLEREGLVRAEGRRGDRSFFITTKGSLKRAELFERRKGELPEISRYRPSRSPNFVIVAFDVPEREARKRVWLREALKNLGLKMLQKSVWIGRVNIPEAFLEDVSHLQLIEHIEIFEVGKTGTLRSLSLA